MSLAAYETKTCYIKGFFDDLEGIVASFDDVYLVSGHATVWREAEGPYSIQIVTVGSDAEEVTDDRGYANFVFYPQGDTAETVKIADRTSEEGEIVIASNKYFTAIFQGLSYSTEGLIYIENNTDSELYFEFSNLSVNDTACECSSGIVAPARTRSLYNSIDWYYDDKGIDIEDIEKITFDMTVSKYLTSDVIGGFDGKTFTIKDPVVLDVY